LQPYHHKVSFLIKITYSFVRFHSEVFAMYFVEKLHPWTFTGTTVYAALQILRSLILLNVKNF
jgi:hypothetical protein